MWYCSSATQFQKSNPPKSSKSRGNPPKFHGFNGFSIFLEPANTAIEYKFCKEGSRQISCRNLSASLEPVNTIDATGSLAFIVQICSYLLKFLRTYLIRYSLHMWWPTYSCSTVLHSASQKTSSLKLSPIRMSHFANIPSETTTQTSHPHSCSSLLFGSGSLFF